MRRMSILHAKRCGLAFNLRSDHWRSKTDLGQEPGIRDRVSPPSPTTGGLTCKNNSRTHYRIFFFRSINDTTCYLASLALRKVIRNLLFVQSFSMKSTANPLFLSENTAESNCGSSVTILNAGHGRSGHAVHRRQVTRTVRICALCPSHFSSHFKS